MAERYAVATGNWSNTATWDGGTLPTAADDVHSNNYTVTIDQDITVVSLKAIAGSTAVAGGYFTTSGSRTITVTDAVYGYNVSSGSLQINSGSHLYGDAKESAINTRYSVSINDGGQMTGDAFGSNAVAVGPGGIFTGNASMATASRNSSSVSISSGGKMIGNATGGIRSVGAVSINGIMIGNTTGGSVTDAYGAIVQYGGLHIGDSLGGTSGTTPGTEIRNGGRMYGNSTGSANSIGVRIQGGGIFVGDATGGTASNCHGVSISQGLAVVGTATGNTANAFGVYSSGSNITVTIENEVGSYAKSLDAGTYTTYDDEWNWLNTVSPTSTLHPLYATGRS